MNREEQSVEYSHGARAHALEQPHPGPGTYVKIAALLAVITLVEVGVYYVEALAPVLVPTFLVLSATKFALVAMFYMHLKFDSRLFSGFFVGGLLVAAAIVIALLALMAQYVPVMFR